MIIGILLILAGVVGLILSAFGFGDIGLSFAFTGIVAILAGIGNILNSRKKKQ